MLMDWALPKAVAAGASLAPTQANQARQAADAIAKAAYTAQHPVESFYQAYKPYIWGAAILAVLAVGGTGYAQYKIVKSVTQRKNGKKRNKR